MKPTNTLAIRTRSLMGVALACCLLGFQGPIISTCKAQTAPSPGPSQLPKVVLIGDSIAWLYFPIVQRELDSTAEVSFYSRSTSRAVLERLDEIIAAKPDLIHINCGLHDMIVMKDTGKTQVPLDEYKSNLEKIFQRLRQETHAQIIWATTTPVSERRQIAPREKKGYGRIVRREDDIKTYNQASVPIAQRLGIKVDDLFEVMTRAGAEQYFRPDGVHFNATGDELFAQAVSDAIRSSIEQPSTATKSNP